MWQHPALQLVRTQKCWMSAAVTMTAAARPCQLLPHQITSSFPFPQEAPNLPLPSSARSTVVSFLYAEGQSQVARTDFFKGHHHRCVILPGYSCPLTLTGRISSCFLRLESFTFQIPFQILRVHRSMSHVLFCFPVAVPTSIAAVVMADIPAVEKLVSPYIHVCVLMFAQSCALGKVCGCTHKSGECRIAT